MHDVFLDTRAGVIRGLEPNRVTDDDYGWFRYGTGTRVSCHTPCLWLRHAPNRPPRNDLSE